MYKLVSALCLQRSIGAQWETKDLSETLVYDIFSHYTKVYLTVTSVYLDQPVHVDIASLRDEFSAYGHTLKQLLSELGTRSLETIAELPNAHVKYAKYSDAFYSGYKVNTTLIGIGDLTKYAPKELTDLKITRPNFSTNMRMLHTHCLLTVNGYLHQTDADDQAAYILDGRKSLDVSNNNQVGILSFLDIGAVKKVAITEENIYSDTDSNDLHIKTYLYLDQDLTNKTVLLSLGGYLMFPEKGVFWQSGEKTFAINWSGFPYLERIFESKQYLDLSSLGLSVSTENPDIMNVAELLSNAVLKKYLTLPQTFFVIVDTPNLFNNKLFLRNCNMPGMFTAYEDPVYPLVVCYGKMAEYWKTEEDGFWSVNVQDSFIRNYVFDYKPKKQLVNITSNALPTKTFYHSQGHLLQIGSYK